MTYARRVLGATDLSVSPVGLGGGLFGGYGPDPALVGAGTPEADCRRLLDAAVDLGVDFIETADAYGLGRSEEILGGWLAARGPAARDRLVIATKTGVGGGLSRARILAQIDASLARLCTDRVDVYLMHAPDPHTPLDETLRAFDDLVRAGKVRWTGASGLGVREVHAAIDVAARCGARPIACVGRPFSLAARSDEHDVQPACARAGIAYLAYSPLAGGLLAGRYRRGAPPPAGSRYALYGGDLPVSWTETSFDALDALRAHASARGTGVAALALAWVLACPGVTTTLCGPRTLAHLDAVREALDLVLDAGERAALGALFGPP